ncbi:hypothetical protein [Streptomyces atratus]|uniref:hypothetical protein n=1 Tax=Streptomyces atratus TaxID=1893 RepID=UPI002259B728|nr:hypothetical protein [Streptomyces atratus]MCX5339695.1 hypothetical protein [Streptomyces atratus]
MTVHQGAWKVRDFTKYLRDLVALLDPGSGWYGVFYRRDPAGMRACLDGAEIPPWDVMESLFQDLAALRGTAYAQRESVRAAELYSASVAAHDRRPGGRQVVVERLELMLREKTYAAQRLRAAGAGATTIPDTEEVAWARDDHERATARCTELRRRLAAVTVPKGWFRTEEPTPDLDRDRDREHEPERGFDAAPRTPRPPAPKRKKPRGARFAGLDVDEADDDGVLVAPVLPVPPTTASVPRGARFGAAPTGGDTHVVPASAALDPEAHRAAADAVEWLLQLRAESRSGEAHVVLCEAAGWPADRLPVLAVELNRAGLDADWATLLWEVSSLPPAELAAAAGALAAAGRPDDCDRLLRQGVARPAAEIADAVVALDRAGRGPQAQALLGAFIRVRTPQDAARVAAGDPHQLVPQLLAAARAVSPAREWDVVHALRVAGIVGAP